MPIIIKGLNIHLDNTTPATDAVMIDHGIACEAFSKSEPLPADIAVKTYPETYHLIPAMIDMHIHGSMGSDVMDATPQALQTIADSLLAQGTVAFLATTMTASIEKIEDVLENIVNFQQAQTRGAKIVGVHLEGPFISHEYAGAQHAKFIIPPDIELFKHWQAISNNMIKMVTLAPELSGAMEFIEYLKSQDIIASFGHSAANYEQTDESINTGITHATHLFNAMRGIHHRKPGAVTALLLRKEVYAELIADGIHLKPTILDLSYQIKTSDRLILVTDAIRAQCMPDGQYELGGQTIIVKDKSVCLPDGTIAGSIITLPEAMKHVLQATNCDMADIVKMVATNPARQLNIPTKGAVVLDHNYNVVDVFQ